MCGFFAKRYKAKKIGRVTGLDAAGMHFDKKNRKARLDHADAQYVDAIHTSRLGMDRRLGRLDFYANNAKTQPGCIMSPRPRHAYDNTHQLRFDPFDPISEALSCSHHRAPLLFAASILHRPDVDHKSFCSFDNFCPCTSLKDFVAGKCKHGCINNPTMGYWSFVAGKVGSFYGKTSASWPYCLD